MTRASIALLVPVFFMLVVTRPSGLCYATESDAPTKIILHPASEPVPALKYLLLPEFMERIPGNAAVHYGKVTAEQQYFFGTREVREEYHQWLETPIVELRGARAQWLDGSDIIASLERGARSEFCDWQLPIRHEPFFSISLPEIQQVREFGRILCARARLQVADGLFEESVRTLQSGYALARNVAVSETIVGGLVGVANCETLNLQVAEFIQQPEAPNLYWALSSLPSPFIDMQLAIEIERHALELSFPEVRDLLTAERTPDEWRETFHYFAQEYIDGFGVRDSPPAPSPEEIDERCKQMLPSAQRALIASGLSEEQVEAMPLHQVAMLYTIELHRKLIDNGIKHYFLPYPEAIAGIEAAMEQASTEGGEIIPVAQLHLPAFRSARMASVRADRQIATLRVFEALRLHAAANVGALPKQLSDVTVVYIPNDPVTGKPFDYRLEEDKAYLSGPPLRDWTLDYEITMGSH